MAKFDTIEYNRLVTTQLQPDDVELLRHVERWLLAIYLTAPTYGPGAYRTSLDLYNLIEQLCELIAIAGMPVEERIAEYMVE